jgi:hypothetical protein
LLRRFRDSYKEKQDLLHVLTDRDTFIKGIQQANDTFKNIQYLKEISAGQDANYIADYFMIIRDKIDLEELLFYWYQKTIAEENLLSDLD